MKYNLTAIMCGAWELYREGHNSFATCLKFAWRAVKGEKANTFDMTTGGNAVKACLVKLRKKIKNGPGDIHQMHKFAVLQAALNVPANSFGIVVMYGKNAGLCRYAIRNA